MKGGDERFEKSVRKMIAKCEALFGDAARDLKREFSYSEEKDQQDRVSCEQLKESVPVKPTERPVEGRSGLPARKIGARRNVCPKAKRKLTNNAWTFIDEEKFGKGSIAWHIARQLNVLLEELRGQKNRHKRQSDRSKRWRR